MRVELIEDADLTTVANLAQLYQYDFTEFVEAEVGSDGRFSFIPVEEYADDRYDPLLINADGKLAGFAIVSFGEAFRDPVEQVWFVDEFFVLRPYRKRGVGESAARALFDSRPGTWEVGQVPRNIPAQRFWRRVIGRYTGGAFEEIVLDDERWAGPVQYFTA